MSYRSRPIDAFLDSIASPQVTPAGGSTAAVVGAMGAALCEIVCIHTIERAGANTADGPGNSHATADGPRDRRYTVDGPRDSHATADALKHSREVFHTQRDHLLTLADADAEAVDALLAATEAVESTRERRSKRAIGVPLTIAESCLTILDEAPTVVTQGTASAVPDAITGAYLTHAAGLAAVFTVRTNLDAAGDPEFETQIGDRAAETERAIDAAFEATIDAETAR